MQLIYYFDEELGGCPVKIYLAQFAKNEKDTTKIKNRKEKILTEIRKRIEYVFGNDGRTDTCFSSSLQGYHYSEIKARKNKDTLIRLCYFCQKDKMILLNAFEKPDNYSKKSEKRIVEKNLIITENYRLKYLTNPKLYKEYE